MNETARCETLPNDAREAGESRGAEQADARLQRPAPPRALRTLSPDAVTRLLKGAVEVHLPLGYRLRGRDGGVAGFLIAGSLRSFIVSPDGRERTVRYLQPGDLVGAPNLVLDTPALHLECLTAAKVVRIPIRQMQREFRDNDAFASAVSSELALDLAAALIELRMSAFGNVRQRIAHQLLTRAEVESNVLTLTHKQVADSVASVREVAARALREIVQRGGAERIGDGRLALNVGVLAELASL